jgi:hypothetical protein
MASQYFINGPAILYVGDAANNNDPIRLGVSVSGVRLSWRRFRNVVHSDVSGPQMPACIQGMGQIAMVSAKLNVVDLDVLDSLRHRGDASLIGLLDSVGALLDPIGFPLWIDGTGDRPHYFYNAILWESEDQLLSTRVTEDDITFYVYKPVDPEWNTVLDAQLWEYSRPPGV